MTQVNFQEVQGTFAALDLAEMKEQWPRLHAGDCEPWPELPALQDAWLLFHRGEFLKAAEAAQTYSAGRSLQLKALSTYAHYLEGDPEQKISRFLKVVELAEEGLVVNAADKANLYYQIAYSLGRYGQFISIAKALAEGIAGRISRALEECLALQPDHADAHTAYATYKAEIIGKLGKMAAKLTYSASAGDAETLYQRGVTLAPYSVSAKTEFADGLLSMYGQKKLKQATALYQQAVEHAPIDALEALDQFLANRELAEA